MNVCKCIRTCLRNLCNISVFSVNAPPHSKIRHSQSFFYRIKSCDKTDKQGKQREKASLKIQKIEKSIQKMHMKIDSLVGKVVRVLLVTMQNGGKK